MYSLTATGDLFLGTWIEALDRYQEVLKGLMEGFAETVPAGGDASGNEEV